MNCVENRQSRGNGPQFWNTQRMHTKAWIPLCAMALALAACGESKQAPAPAAAAAAPPFHTTLTTKQLMSWIIDPNATAIWNSVGSITTEKGTEEKHPQTDEAVEHHDQVEDDGAEGDAEASAH